MPTGPGSLDAQGIWKYGENDENPLASDLLNRLATSVSTQLQLDRSRPGARKHRFFGRQYSPASTVTLATAWTDIPGLVVTLTGVNGKINLRVAGVLLNAGSGAWRAAGLRFLVNGAVYGAGDSNIVIHWPGTPSWSTPVALEEMTGLLTGSVTISVQGIASIAPAVAPHLTLSVDEISA